MITISIDVHVFMLFREDIIIIKKMLISIGREDVEHQLIKTYSQSIIICIISICKTIYYKNGII